MMQDSTYDYNPFIYLDEIFSVIVVFSIILTLYLIFFFKIKKNSNKIESSYVILFMIYIEMIRNLTIQILGKKNEKFTVFFLFLFTYLLFSNLISIFGFVSPTSSLTVTISFAFIIFVGIFVIGIKYQKWTFLKKYTINVGKKKTPIMINPMNIISTFTPLFSLSFRLWGNMFAGTLITLMIITAIDDIFLDKNIPLFGIINIFTSILLVPIHIYFDIVSGVIQTLVFVLLSMIYWKLEMKEQEEIKKIQLT